MSQNEVQTISENECEVILRISGYYGNKRKKSTQCTEEQLRKKTRKALATLNAWKKNEFQVLYGRMNL